MAKSAPKKGNKGFAKGSKTLTSQPGTLGSKTSTGMTGGRPTNRNGIR